MLTDKDKDTINKILPAITEVFEDMFIQNAVLANIKKETNFVLRSESSYGGTSVERLKKIFQSRLKGIPDEELEVLKKDDIAFYDKIYGGKMGNVNPGDGFRYRGRGFIQFTGKDNYIYYGKLIKKDLVGNPDLMNDTTVATETTVAFIKVGLKNKTEFNTQEEANRAVTQIIGGKSLNLDVGIGLEILTKVNTYANEINEYLHPI